MHKHERATAAQQLNQNTLRNFSWPNEQRAIYSHLSRDIRHNSSEINLRHFSQFKSTHRTRFQRSCASRWLRVQSKLQGCLRSQVHQSFLLIPTYFFDNTQRLFEPDDNSHPTSSRQDVDLSDAAKSRHRAAFVWPRIESEFQC